MKNKIIGIFVCMLLMTTCVVPVIGELNILKNKGIKPLHLENNTSIKFIIAGNELRALRSYFIHVLPSYDGLKPFPLVFVLDGSGYYYFLYPFGCFFRNNIEFYTNFSQKADAEGFIVVYPIQKVILDTGLGPWFYTGKVLPIWPMYKWDFEYYPWWSFKFFDDMGFMQELIDKMEQDYTINSSRIYIAGISDGARMAYSIGSYLSDTVAAIAPVDGSIGHRTGPQEPMYYIPTPKNPVSVIAFIGHEDDFWYNGTYCPSVNESISFWVEHNGCNFAYELISPSGKIIHSVYTNGNGGTEVELYEIAGGVHTWPGNPMDNPDSELSATNLIWEFFEAHPKQ